MKTAPDEQLPLYGAPLSAATARPALAVSRLPPALSSSSPLQAAIVAWCDHLRQESNTENTVKAFGGDLRQLSAFVSAAKNVGQVTTRELNDWLAWQRNVKRCSPKTYARRITSLKSFFRWLTETNVIGRDPAAAIIQQTVLSPLPEILSTQEVEAALAAAEIALKIVALVSLYRRPAAEVRGPKAAWAAAILLSGLFCYLLTLYLTRPILRLRKATEDLSAGDLSARAPAEFAGGMPRRAPRNTIGRTGSKSTGPNARNLPVIARRRPRRLLPAGSILPKRVSRPRGVIRFPIPRGPVCLG